MDALHVDKAILAGHSLAGVELTHFAATHPHRVEKLVYLDALRRRVKVAKDAENRAFRYNLRLRLSTLEGVRNMYYESATRQADDIKALKKLYTLNNGEHFIIGVSSDESGGEA